MAPTGGASARGPGQAARGPAARTSLPRELGNQLFGRLVASGAHPHLQRCSCGGTCAHCRGEDEAARPLQTKLRVGPAGDACEREADRVADGVMRQPAAAGERVQRDPVAAEGTEVVQRQEAEEEDERELVQAKPSGAARADGGGVAPAAAADVLRTPGQPLDPATREFMEPRFGRDFGRVQVHAGPQAAAAARSVDARAYTVGDHLVFGAGEYAPGGEAGRRLLAHELTHVVQQGAAAPGGDRGRGTQPDPTLRRTKKGSGSCAAGTKTVTVDMFKLDGATRTPSTDLATANTVFAPCCVQFTAGKDETIDNATTKSWLTDLAINTSPTCTADPEEVKAYAGVAGKFSLSGRVRSFWAQSITGASFDAYSYHAGCGSSTNEMAVVSNAAGPREFAHELGHILLNEANTAHSPDVNNVMADPDPGTTFTATQCATIYANA